MPLARGSRIGPYEITSQIGAGGMGVVFRAHDTKLGGMLQSKFFQKPLLRIRNASRDSNVKPKFSLH